MVVYVGFRCGLLFVISILFVISLGFWVVLVILHLGLLGLFVFCFWWICPLIGFGELVGF